MYCDLCLLALLYHNNNIAHFTKGNKGATMDPAESAPASTDSVRKSVEARDSPYANPDSKRARNDASQQENILENEDDDEGHQTLQRLFVQ